MTLVGLRIILIKEQMVYHIKNKQHVLTVMSLMSLLSANTCLPGSAGRVCKTTPPLFQKILENNRPVA